MTAPICELQVRMRIMNEARSSGVGKLMTQDRPGPSAVSDFSTWSYPSCRLGSVFGVEHKESSSFKLQKPGNQSVEEHT
jgi:hypothetical protein